ncbi:MAG: beta-ketoacyl-[acyl-carrier-protein] synthase family protein [Planctomycetaceae bacterium]
MRRRVVITGMGCVTPLGASTADIWHRLTEGRSGVGRLTLFDASRFPVQIAAEVRDWNLSDVGEDPRRWQHCPRQTTFALGAGIKAAREAGLDRALIDPLRFGVYLGCGEAFEDFSRFAESISRTTNDGQYRLEQFTQTALRVFNPDAEREYEPHMPACHLAAMFDAQGPNANCIAACVSSAHAIGEAARLIRRGDADVMLAGGAHSVIHPFGLTGFQRLSALSTRNSEPERAVRPFERDRDGFVLGEGGAVFVLEELEHAKSRGVEIWGEFSACGSAQDAYRVTDTHPEGRGAATAMKLALAEAKLNFDDIDYINAHGTGTILNDKIETLVIKRVFGQQAYRIPVSSSKSMLGHFTTASAAIELAVCLMAIRFGVIPPTINYENADPDCDLDYVPNIARDLVCNHVMSNSIGFGGQNAVVIVSRYNGRSSASATLRRAA